VAATEGWRTGMAPMKADAKLAKARAALKRKRASGAGLSHEERRRAKRLESGLGSIECGKTYRLDLFQSLTGIGDASVRSMERDGLVVTGGRGVARFITGDEWHRFIAAETEKKRAESK